MGEGDIVLDRIKLIITIIKRNEGDKVVDFYKSLF